VNIAWALNFFFSRTTGSQFSVSSWNKKKKGQQNGSVSFVEELLCYSGLGTRGHSGYIHVKYKTLFHFRSSSKVTHP